MQVIGMGDEPPYLSDDQYSDDDDDENEVAQAAAPVADSASWHLRQVDASRSSSSLATSSGASLRPSPLNGHPLAAAAAASSASSKLRQPSTFARAGAMALGGGGGDGNVAAGSKPLSARRSSSVTAATSSQTQVPPPQRAMPPGSNARPLPGSSRGGSSSAAAASASSSGRGAAPAAASGLPPRRPGAGGPLPLISRSNSNRSSALPVGGSTAGSALPSAPSPTFESRDLPSVRNRYASGLFGNMCSSAGIGGSGGGGRLGGNNVSPLVHAASVAALASVSAWGRDEFQSSSSSDSDDDGPWFGGRGSDDESRGGDDCDADVEFDPDDFRGVGDEGDDFDAGSVRRRGRAINDGEPEVEEEDEEEDESEPENEADGGASADGPKRQHDGRRTKDAVARAATYRERALLAESRVGGALSLPGDDAGASDDEYAVRLPASSDSLLECGEEAGARAPFGDFERVFPFNATTAHAANALLTPGDSRNTPANVFQQFLRVAVGETRVALAAAIAPPKKAKKMKKKKAKPAAASGDTDDFN